MLRKIKTKSQAIASLLSAQEILDTVLAEEDNINYIVEYHDVNSVEELIKTMPSTAYYENVIDTCYDDDITLDDSLHIKEKNAFYKKRMQDFADSLEDFKQTDIYESFAKVQELYSYYESKVKECL